MRSAPPARLSHIGWNRRCAAHVVGWGRLPGSARCRWRCFGDRLGTDAAAGLTEPERRCIAHICHIGFMLGLGTPLWVGLSNVAAMSLSVCVTFVYTRHIHVDLRIGFHVLDRFLKPAGLIDLIRIDDEIVRVTEATGLVAIVLRGQQGTEAVAHEAEAALFRGRRVSLVEFFTGTKWSPQIGQFGILPLVTATLVTSAIAMLVALPLASVYPFMVALFPNLSFILFAGFFINLLCISDWFRYFR